MDQQPEEILIQILSYLDGLDSIRALQVCTKWKNLMENKILVKNPVPSFEECVIASDYFHFRKHLTCIPTREQKQLIKLVDNKVFIKCFGIKRCKFKLNDLLMKYFEVGSFRAIKFLVEKGANVKLYGYIGLEKSASRGDIELVKYLVEKGAYIHADNDIALGWSAANGHLEVVKFLVEKGANIYAANDYALRWSAQNGHIEIVKFLVEKGANINVLSSEQRKKYNLN